MPQGIGLDRSTMMFCGNDFFGLEKLVGLDIDLTMVPPFDTVVISEDEQTVTARGAHGGITRSRKDGMSMPQYISFAVTNRKDFEALKHRYDPSSTERFPPHWGEILQSAATRQYPVIAPFAGSIGLYWQLRIWMGTENSCTIFYDDPSWAHEMLDFVADFIIATMGRVMAAVEIDIFCYDEDFAFKTGPLISPNIFKEFFAPRYRRVNDFLLKNGVDVIMMDSDGNPCVLIPHLLECGINLLWPLEQCHGDMNPVKIRKQYGRSLVLWGGIDKRALAKDRKAIENELYSKVPPLIEEGGFIPGLDHLAPPDIPYENWLYYLEIKRKLLGG